jgi:hypothetical protein
MAGITVDMKGIADGVTAVGGLLKDVKAMITGKEVIPPEVQVKLAEIDANLANAQAAIDAAEASNPNIFISGWRPAIGWTGALIIFFAYIVKPVLVSVGVKVPDIAMGDLWPVILGILGLGTMRSVEKVKGAEGNR